MSNNKIIVNTIIYILFNLYDFHLINIIKEKTGNKV